MSISYILSLVVLSLSVVCAAPCTASASVNARQDASWTSSGVNYQLYDVTVTNSGSYAISTLSALFTVGSGSTFSGSFNYDPSSGAVSGFGGSLAPQASFNGAGFTIAGSGVPTLVSVTPTCPSAPSTTGSSTSSPPATSAPTTAPTVSATSAPTSLPMATAQNCYNQCTQEELCIVLDESGVPRCHPQICAALDCGAGHVCINDGGLARCVISGPVSSTPAPGPTQPPSAANCYNECTGSQICASLTTSSAPQCHETRCAAILCEDEKTCDNSSGIAICSSAVSATATATGAPSSAPSSAPTSAPTFSVTQAPTFAVTATPSLAPSCDCSVSASVSQRANAAYVVSGNPCQIYDLTLTSHGSSSVDTVSLVIMPTSPSAIAQDWNLTPLGSNQYDVSTFGALNVNGANFFGAGFVVCGPGSGSTPSLSVSNFNCVA